MRDRAQQECWNFPLISYAIVVMNTMHNGPAPKSTILFPRM